MSKIETAVEDAVQKILEDYPDFELIDVEYVKEGNYFLRVFIDKPGGFELDDCQTISEKLSEVLDTDEKISSLLNDNYMLEVSSPGIDRILKKDRDFVREAGKKVDVSLFKPRDEDPLKGKKFFTGILIGLENKIVSVEIEDGSRLEVPLKEIGQIRLHVDF